LKIQKGKGEMAIRCARVHIHNGTILPRRDRGSPRKGMSMVEGKEEGGLKGFTGKGGGERLLDEVEKGSGFQQGKESTNLRGCGKEERVEPRRRVTGPRKSLRGVN